LREKRVMESNSVSQDAADPGQANLDPRLERACEAMWPSWKNPALRSDLDRERMKQVLDAASGDERQAGYQAGIQAALKAIAAIPAPASLDQMNGHEDAYRAVETLVAAKMPPSPDRRAIKMLVDTGCVPREVAIRALQVAHGFERGPV